ncbi:MAG TPA: twin-arginine translocation signal domain-containing protein, partial [Bryobacteraceae bacterium]|nr:twin-arginine translocation signal domain-containing protein [Bryobacteraceae bacterium]
MPTNEPRTNESRRRFLQTSGLGIGWLAAMDLLQQNAMASPVNPLAPKAPPMKATAKRVISLFMQGGPSQL